MSRYLLQRGGQLIEARERDRLLYWYIHTFLWGRYSGMTESNLNKDLELIATVTPQNAGEGINRLIEALRQERGELRLNEADFRGSSKGNRFYPLLYMMTRVCHTQDWATGDELSSHLLGHLCRLELHHIFPKAMLYKHKYTRQEVNAIANFTFLIKETNLAVSNRNPAEYIPDYDQKYPGAVGTHWIPMNPELWKVENYRDFLAERRRLLAIAANEFLDKLLTGGVPEPIHEVSVTERTVSEMVGAIEDEDEEHKLRDCNKWVVKQGLPEGEVGYELCDPATGEALAALDLAWPNGLQEGLSQPVAVLLGEGPEVEEVANTAGFRFFTSIKTFRDYVRREILASPDKESESEELHD
jgi:hypothetical protein